VDGRTTVLNKNPRRKALKNPKGFMEEQRKTAATSSKRKEYRNLLKKRTLKVQTCSSSRHRLRGKELTKVRVNPWGGGGGGCGLGWGGCVGGGGGGWGGGGED